MNTVKVTRIKSWIGFQSIAEPIEIVGDVLRFPEATDNDAWGVYVPLQNSGHLFYKLTELKESEVAALKNREYVLNYQESSLLGVEAAPHTEEESKLESEQLSRNVLIAAHNLLCKRGHKECDCNPAIFAEANEFPELLDVLDADLIG